MNTLGVGRLHSLLGLLLVHATNVDVCQFDTRSYNVVVVGYWYMGIAVWTKIVGIVPRMVGGKNELSLYERESLP